MVSLGLRPPAACAERRASIRQAGPLSPVARARLVQWVDDGMAGGDAIGDGERELLARSGAQSVEEAVMVCVTAGLDVEPLDDAERTILSHFVSGHSSATCRRQCGLGSSWSITERIGVICRKLRASTMPSAVRAADRTGQLDVALPSQVAWLAEHGVPASLAPVIRARSCGLPANTAAEVCRVSPERTAHELETLLDELGLIQSHTPRTRFPALLAAYLAAGEPIRRASKRDAQYTLGHEHLVVFHRLVLSRPDAEIAAALGVPPTEVTMLRQDVALALRSGSDHTTAARAARLGLLRLPSSQNEPLRRMADPVPQLGLLLRILQALADGHAMTRLNELPEFHGIRVRSLLKGERERVGVGTNVNLVMLAAMLELITISVDEPGAPLCAPAGPEPHPDWADLESYRDDEP